MNLTLLETKSREKKAIHNLLTGLICLAVTLGILFSIFAVRYHYFLKELVHYEDWAASTTEKDSEFPKLTPPQMANLGFAHTEEQHPATSYIKFPFEKKPGTIRIGTFGDSHTQGIEAALGHDYPSFLKQHFQKAGLDHIEVINFGVKSYGIHQSYLMWKYLGQKYDLDYVIFMLLRFHADRDFTFIEDNNTATGIHARFIVKGNQLEFVPVVGESRKEASLNYFRMFPPWRYIRYDRRAPSFMRALLPPGREWKVNPFYYKLGRPWEEEVSKSYALLFDQLAKEVKNVIVLAHDDFMGGLAKQISASNVYVLRSRVTPILNWGPYLAPKSHQSALGNDLQAREVFELLTGEENPHIPVIRLKASSEHGQYPFPTAVEPINRYKRIFVKLAGYPAGAFTINKRRGERIKKEVSLKRRKVASLLFLSLSDMSFLPLNFLPKQDAPVSVTYETPRGSVHVPIGKIDTVAGVVSRIVLPISGSEKLFSYDTENGSLRLDRGMSRLTLRTLDKVSKVKIFAGDQEIPFKIKVEHRGDQKSGAYFATFRLKPKEKLFYLRANAGQYVPVESVEPKKGPLKLVLTHKDGSMQEIPFFLEYDIRIRDPQPFHPLYLNPIATKNASPLKHEKM